MTLNQSASLATDHCQPAELPLVGKNKTTIVKLLTRRYDTNLGRWFDQAY